MGAGEEETLLAQICHDDLQTALGGFRDLRVLSVAEVGHRPARCRLRRLDRELRAFRLGARERGLSHQPAPDRDRERAAGWTRQLSVGQTNLGAAIDDLVARIAGAILPVVERDVSRVLEEAHDTDPAA